MKISKIFLPLLTAIFCVISSSSFAAGGVLEVKQLYEEGALKPVKEQKQENAEKVKSTAQKKVQDAQDEIATKKSEYQGEPILTPEQQTTIANDKAKLKSQFQAQGQQKKQNAKNTVNHLKQHPTIR